MLEINSISPSRIKTFDTCLFKYWLTYHRPDVNMKSNWGAEHGTLIHDILENFVTQKDKDWMRRLLYGYAGKLKTTDKFNNEVILPSPLIWAKDNDFKLQKPKCILCPYNVQNTCAISLESLDNLSGCPRKLFDESIKIIESVIKRYNKAWNFVLKNESGQIIGCEYSYKVSIPGMGIPSIGIMDLILKHNDDTLEIIDYKSGKWTQTEAECKEDIQVRMYSLIAYKEFVEDINNKGYKYKNIILTFDYFQGTPITVTLSPEENKKTESFILNKANEIKNTKVINRIVTNNDDFLNKKFWKCRSLCDIEVCKKEWTGQFKV